MRLLVDGHCPVCQGPTQIEVVQVDDHTTSITCVAHPQFSHRLTLPVPIPLGYAVATVHHSGQVSIDGLVHDTPQQAAEGVDRLRASRPDAWLARYAVATVTLIEDPS